MKTLFYSKILGISARFLLPLMCCVSCESFESKDEDFLTYEDELWYKNWSDKKGNTFLEDKTGDMDTMIIDKIYKRNSFKLVDNVDEVDSEKRYKKGEIYIKFRIRHDGLFYEGLFKKEGGGRLKDKLELYINGEPFRRTVINANKENRKFAKDLKGDTLKFVNYKNNSIGIDYIVLTENSSVIKFSINGEIYNFNASVKYNKDW